MKVKEEDLTRFAQANGVSPREKDVIKCMLNRKISIKEIAKELGLSPSTINNHLNNIFTKTKTSSKAELMVCLIHGLSEKISNLEDYKKTPKVLVIDDEPDIARLLKHELEACGFEVYLETDSTKVLEVVKKHELDFIVSDIRMPKMNGYDLLHQVRGIHKYKPEIVFISGYNEYTQEYAYDLGAIAMFSKPVRSEKIVNVLMESFIEETSNKKKYLGHQEPQHGVIQDAIAVTKDNVGTGGLFLRVDDSAFLGDKKLDVGQRLAMHVQLPNDGGVKPVVVEIKWRRLRPENGLLPGIGMKFVNLEEDVRDLIYNFTRENEILSYIPMGKCAS